MTTAMSFQTFASGQFWRNWLCLIVAAACWMPSVSPGNQVLASDFDRIVQEAVRQVSPCVVRFETVGGLEKVDGRIANTGPSTGVVVSPEGLVISAAINFAHQPAAIFARLPNGEKVSAEIICRDTSRNLVLLRVKASQSLTIPATVARHQLRVGQTAIAVGRVYDDALPNISTGIISATNRIWGKAIQTDAKISPANFGGPLLDLQGRVIGILTPLAPDEESVFAGADWYDSGIGFAVPLAEVLARLPTMREIPEIRAGRLGLNFKGTDIYADSATIAYCSFNSPAANAGLRPGDTIVAVNQEPIESQSQLKHALGPLYENDIVTVDVVRAGEQLNFRIQLAGEIEVYQPTALGILPVLGEDPDSLQVRYVFPESAAAVAGLRPRDVIVAANGEKCRSWRDIREVISLLNVGERLKLTFDREGVEQEATAIIQKQSADPPANLALNPEGQADKKWPVIEVKVAEFANKCYALVPGLAEPSAPTGVVVWIPPPGQIDAKKFLLPWRQYCAARNLVLLVPQSLQQDRWRPDEVQFVTKALSNLKKRERVLGNRVVIGGQKSGGAMAALVASSRRDLFFGLILLDSGLPDRIEQLSTSPVNPLLLFLGSTKEFEAQSEFHEVIEILKQSRIPYFNQHGGSANLANWIDTLMNWADAVDRL